MTNQTAQHVTMNVADRPRFFAEAFRVLKPGGFFALTEHGLGPRGDPHHPVPWSQDGGGAHLCTPSETRALLAAAGFEDVVVEDTGPKYVAGYKAAIEPRPRASLSSGAAWRPTGRRWPRSSASAPSRFAATATVRTRSRLPASSTT